MTSNSHIMDSNCLKIVQYTPSLTGRKNRKGRTRPAIAKEPFKIRNACVACRQKKTRCSGHSPCTRCHNLDQVCTYMPTVSTTPTRACHTNESASSTSYSTVNTVRETSNHPIITQKDATEEPAQEDQYGHFHGSASGFAFLQLARNKLARLPSVSISFHDYPLTDSDGSPPLLPPKSVAGYLIEHYFDFGLAVSRFVHKPTIVTLHEELYSLEGEKTHSGDELALLYMVLAIGSHYSSQNHTFCGFSASVRLFGMAQQALQSKASKTTLSAIQAQLLMTHYLLNHSRMHEAWSSFGTLVRHAQALRLDRASPSPIEDHITNEYRKRVFWSIYTYDRILSSVFGRPCALHDDDIDQDECAFTDDEISVTQNQSTNASFSPVAALIHYARLAKLLGQILRQFYSPARKHHTFQTLQQNLTQFESSLQEWLQNLPPYLNFTTLPKSAMSTLTQRQMCTLRLAFALVQLLLYRPFILYSIREPDIDTEIASFCKTCGDRSLNAAMTVIDECRDLLGKGLYSRVFWLVNYVQFAALGTLYIHSCLWPEQAVRSIADEALASFPVGVEGDLVGQRYLGILRELQKITEVFGCGDELGCQNTGLFEFDVGFEYDAFGGSFLGQLFDPGLQ